jgi:hypothetical protein
MSGPTLFILPWLVIWTAAGAFTAAAWANNIWGREVVIFDGASIRVRRELGRLSRERRFQQGDATNLRFSPPVYGTSEFGRALQPWGLGSGSVAFDIQGHTHRFGETLTEAESLAIIATIQERYRIGTPDR